MHRLKAIKQQNKNLFIKDVVVFVSLVLNKL